MKLNCIYSLLFTSLMAFALGSCSLLRPYQSPDVVPADLYRGVAAADTNTMANLHWSEVFTDTILQGLIREGIARNPDLLVAYTRVQQARAYYLQSRAAFFPTLIGDARVARANIPDIQNFGQGSNTTLYQLELSSSWELDVWGRIGSNRRASLASLLQTEAAARAVQTSLVATIANSYYLLLALDQQLAITQQTVFNWDTTVYTMRALKEAARVTEAAVVQSEAQRYAAEVTIPDLKQLIRETENTLSILLGYAPNAIRRSTLEEQHTVEVLLTGIPAQLLAYRPDVEQAEFNYRATYELTNVARASFYPSIVITGSTGLASLELSDLLNPAAVAASIAGGLTQPIFNQRVNRTRLAVAKAQQEEALINFRNTLLIAGQEVSDAISLYETALEKANIRSYEIRALEQSVAYSQELLRNGFANYTEIITARQSLLQAQLGRVNDKLQQLQATVNLYRSLGGGWR
jgi:outer membrane protein, multidrug efflux system